MQWIEMSSFYKFEPTSSFYTRYMRTAKAHVRLHGRTCSPEPNLLFTFTYSIDDSNGQLLLSQEALHPQHGLKPDSKYANT